MPYKKYLVTLAPQERQHLRKFVSAGPAARRQYAWAGSIGGWRGAPIDKGLRLRFLQVRDQLLEVGAQPHGVEVGVFLDVVEVLVTLVHRVPE